jgi:predicted RecB family nuclease
MRTLGDRLLFSATDLCDFAACRYITHLGLRDQHERLERAEEDSQAALVIKKGEQHEKRYCAALEQAGYTVAHVPQLIDVQPIDALKATIEILKQGPEFAFQAFLYREPLNGYADFLKRVERPSKLGNFSYEVIDTKLSKTEKSAYILQLCFYSELLADIQGHMPDSAHIVTGDMQLKSFRLRDYLSYYSRLKRDFLSSLEKDEDSEIYPEPCAKCASCRWRNICTSTWEQDDHLSLVATITRGQRIKLEQAGIQTCADLADPSRSIPHTIHPETLARLRDQATLQKKAASSGQPHYRVIPPDEGGRGFALLPPHDEGDIFYDIEGDPLVREESLKGANVLLRDGLEYLHGFSWRKPDGTLDFRPFWALSKHTERRCFEDLMDFLTERMAQHPKAHIYHYSPYEIAALKRLSSQYPTRVKQLDDLLRGERFCDLYTVVKQAVRVSEPRYSIKNLERFYSVKREQDVKDGGASIVWFEDYLENKDPKLLEAIRVYNQKDCDSMIELYDWLSTLKATSADEFGIDWDSLISRPQKETPETSTTELSKAQQEEHRVARFRELFRIDEIPAVSESERTSHADLLRTRLFYLSDFYRREMKPQWWNHYRRRDLLPMERADDPEVLTGCTRDTARQEEKIARSKLVHYTFPTQETKLTAGDQLYDIENERSFGSIHEINPDEGTVTIKIGTKLEAPATLELSRSPRDTNDLLKNGLDRFLDAVAGNDLSNLGSGTRNYPYPALVDILTKALPAFTDGRNGEVVSVAADDPTFSDKLTDAALHLDSSYLFIQGPPGTGKTYHGARVAVALMRAGKRIAVLSNSHKAIINFLLEVDVVAYREHFTFRGAKKSNQDEEKNTYSYNHPTDLPPAQIHDYYDHKAIDYTEYNLIAGTAWTFTRDEQDQKFDYLIVDEASQISLAHLATAGVCAKNLILIGDPRQLPQPLQGIHPAGLDQSPLEYLLDDHATVPPERGVFLNSCRRMHTDICTLLSDHVYDSRLTALPENKLQKILSEQKLSLQRDAGYLFYSCEHDGNTQTSHEEAELIRALYQELLSCSFRSKTGAITPITPADIMVIAPYNMQVQLLRRAIPNGDVGTIDLFQGREAPVVLISMTTSSIEDSPRGMEFLFSQQRMNVALSRAKALAVVVGSPRLFQARCTKPEQMRLVNFFCALEQSTCS